MVSNYLKWSLIGLVVACAVAFVTSDYRRVVYGRVDHHPTLGEFMDSLRAEEEPRVYDWGETKQGPAAADPWDSLR